MQSKFIVFEGIDGSGKSTLANSTMEILKRRGISAVLSCEPTREGEIGKLIRKILTHQVPMPRGDAFALLFEADRLEHKQWIRDQLDDGVTVVCDRYELSTIAYQATWHHDDSDATRSEIGRKRSMLRRIQRQYPLPADMTFVLNLPVEDALARLQTTRGSLDVYETRHTLESAAHFYKTAADSCSTHVYIDARQPIHLVSQAVERELSNLWAEW